MTAEPLEPLEVEEVPLFDSEVYAIEVDEIEDLEPQTPIADLLALARRYPVRDWHRAADRCAYHATADACRSLAWLRNGLDTLEPSTLEGER